MKTCGFILASVSMKLTKSSGTDGGDLPTARAITEHIGKLRSQAGGAGKGATPSKATPASRKRALPSTAPTSEKRFKAATPSKTKRPSRNEDDDEESEIDVDANSIKLESVGPRRSLARSSKPAGKIYKDGADSEDDEDFDEPVVSQGTNGACEDFGLRIDGATDSFGIAGPMDFTARLNGRELGLNNNPFLSANISAADKTVRGKGKRSMRASGSISDDSDVSDWEPGF